MREVSLYFVLATLLGGCASTGAANPPAAPGYVGTLAGTWVEKANPVVSWVEPTPIIVELAIAPDGHISGTVGDARIASGSIKPGRNKLTTALDWGSEYVAVCKLDGNVIERENIHRDSVNLIFDREGDALDGGFHTSGSKFGGAKSMKLSATMTLYRKTFEDIR
jgi:hypothetical protein